MSQLKTKRPVFVKTSKYSGTLTAQIVSYDHTKEGSPAYIETEVIPVNLNKKELTVAGYFHRIERELAEEFPSAFVTFKPSPNVRARCDEIYIEFPMQQVQITLGIYMQAVKDDYSLHDEIKSELAKAKITKFAGYSGHTEFLAADKMWYSFDRLGVEDSFYGESVTCSPLSQLKKELEKVEKSRKRHAESVPVPGMRVGKRYTPSELEAAKDKLKKGGLLSFMPSGFGTGYYLGKRSKVKGFQVQTAPPETCKFFGFETGELAYESVEMD